MAIFKVVGEVAVAGPVQVFNFTVILAASVFVVNNYGDWGAGGESFKNTGKNFHLVFFAAGG